MEQKLRAKGWPLEPARLPDASDEDDPPAPAPDAVARDAARILSMAEERTPAELVAQQMEPPPHTAPSHEATQAEGASDDTARPVEHPIRLVPPPPRRLPPSPSTPESAAAAVAVLRAAVNHALSAQAAPAEPAEPAVAIPPAVAAASLPPPVTPGTVVPRVLSNMVDAEGGRGVTHARGSSPEWTPSPTADSMVVALTHEAMTGGEWLARRSIPPPARPFAPIAPGLLGLTVDGLVLIRARTLAALVGDVHTEPTARQTPEEGLGKHLGGDTDPLLSCTGNGQVHLDPGTDRVAVLKVENGEATVLESALFGCSSGLAREDISLTLDLEGPRIPAVRLRGTGVVAVRSQSSVRAVPCQKGVPLRISTEHLLAFEGPLTWVAAPTIAGLANVPMPRAAVLEGQGVVLLRAGTRA